MKSQLFLKTIALVGLVSLVGCSKKEPLTNDAEVYAQNSTDAVAMGGAAPSMHLTLDFGEEGVLMMQKIKVTQSAEAAYFSIINFNGGYMGIQQPPAPDTKLLIASLWDVNTAAGIHATVAYHDPNTDVSRFGGEGDGAKTINSHYNWNLNTWYNCTVRAWKKSGNNYVAVFIQDMSTNIWFHTCTLTRPDATSTYLGKSIDAFLEDWVYNTPTDDGRSKRKAFFKDAWLLDTNGAWQKHTARKISANDNDAVRNGIYDKSYNGGYDATEDAYFMEHGGDVMPDASFNNTRVLQLPVQTNQGNQPVLTTGSLLSLSASYANGAVAVSWKTDSTKSPQFISKVEILNSSKGVVSTKIDSLPQERSTMITTPLQNGAYTAKLTITDIFNQLSTAITQTFNVSQ